MEIEEISDQIENRLYLLKVISLTSTNSPNISSNNPPANSSTNPPITFSNLSFIIELEVKGISSWLIKVKRGNIIINDSELIFKDIFDINATIIFDYPEVFWSIINSKNIEEDFKSSRDVRFTGTWDYVSILLNLFSEQNLRINDNKKYPMITTTTNRKKTSKEKVNEGTKSIKSGWLHKKRDIIAGWRHRYFKLYIGRIEYYTDHTAIVPRGVIPLYGSEVSGPKPCSVNGNEEHWSITVEARHRDKSFKLASDKIGQEGKLEAEAWIQAIREATKLSDPLSSSSIQYGSSSPSTAASHSENGFFSRKRSGSTTSARSSPPTSSNNIPPPILTNISPSTINTQHTILPSSISNQPSSSSSSTTKTTSSTSTSTGFNNQITSPTNKQNFLTSLTEEKLQQIRQQKHYFIYFLLILIGIGVYLHQPLTSPSTDTKNLTNNNDSNQSTDYIVKTFHQNYWLTIGCVVIGLILLTKILISADRLKKD